MRHGDRGGIRLRSIWWSGVRPIATLTVSLAILPLAAGCSGSSLPSFGSSNPQSQPASVPPPPNSSVAPAGQQAYAPPPSQPAAPATAAPAAQPGLQRLPYPKQSPADVFRDSTQPQGQTVPRPPGTYTPSGQPYAPQGQAGGTASVAAAPPASPDTSNMLAYPKQSLFEVMSNK
jgi:hypothetical protein